MSSLRLGLTLVLLFATAVADAGCTITVNGDGIGGDVADAELTLTEVAGIAEGRPLALSCLTQAELDQIAGELAIPVIPGTCGTLEPRFSIVGGCGQNDEDQIRFADSVGTVPFDLLNLFNGDDIDGLRPSGGRVTLVGAGGGAVAAVIVGAYVFTPGTGSTTLANLIIHDHPGTGIQVDDLIGTTVITGVDVYDNGGDGIRVGTPPGSISPRCPAMVEIGGTGPGQENYIFGNGGWGIAAYQPCNDASADPRGVRIRNTFIGMDSPAGLSDRGNGLGGVYARFIDNLVIGGSATTERNYIGWNDGPGIRIEGRSGATPGTEPRIEGNWIGLARDISTSARPNASGIVIGTGTQLRIGGVLPAQGNVIAGNTGHGISNDTVPGIALAGLLLQNNIIGLNPARTFVLSNGLDGIALSADGEATIRDNVVSGNAGNGIRLQEYTAAVVANNVVGLRGPANTFNDNTATGNGQSGIRIDASPGNTIGPGNRIAANAFFGVHVVGEAADGNVIKGNVIGLSSGNDARPNSVGALIEGGADGTLVGGSAAADRNTISGNTFEGVRITGSGTAGSVVRNNRIGTTPAGTGDLGNGSRGVRTDGGAGGSEVVDNLIAGNGSDGVLYEAVTGSSKVQGNTIGLDANGAVLPNAQSGVAIAAAATGVLVGGGPVPNTISGNANYGVYIAGVGTTGNIVQGNLIGGSGALGNGLAGVTIRNGAQDNQIDGNTIIGHSGAPGIEIVGNGTRLNAVRNNRIGIDAGESAIANQAGVLIAAGASDNSVGSGGRNTISGNTGDGVRLTAAGAFNVVEANYIGVGSAGGGDRGNGGDGVRVEAGSGNTAIRDNVISGNGGAGVHIRDASTVDTTLVRNRIGINAGATLVVPNDGDGIHIAADAQRTSIGFAASASNANQIRGNGGAGIRVVSGQDNRIRVNAIGPNGGLGIDLGPPGVTVNDSLDADTGANGLQNFPLLSNVLRNAGMVSMTIALNSTPATDFRVNLFRNADCDGAGHGEGEAYVGEVLLTTDAGGAANAGVMFPLADAVPVLAWTATATATISSIERGTSELGPCAVTTVLGDLLFTNSFESIALAPQGIPPTAEGLHRTGAGSAVLNLRWRNDRPTIDPAGAIDIRSSRATIVGNITAIGAKCELLGAIACELPERLPGSAAEVSIPLRFADGPFAVDVELRDAAGRVEQRRYVID